MSILTVGSSNPDLSFVLSKNPATILDSGKPFQRELRKGRIYGWFSKADNSEFRLWFKDSESGSSFSEGALGEYEYLDRTRYSSPYLPIMMIQHALATCSKSQVAEDVDASAYAETVIRVSSMATFNALVRHYDGVASITYQEVQGRHLKIRVEAPTVFTTLNVLMTVCFLQAVRDSETYVPLDKDSVSKYLRVLNNSRAPYYVRYLLASRVINNRHMFEKFREDLQGPGMVMSYGDTRWQRYDAIQAHLPGGQTLYDIGCGEMFYSARLRQRYDCVYAIDADEEIASVNARKVESRNFDNVTAIHAEVTPEYVRENLNGNVEGSDILATEVLEHMPRDQADALLKALLETDARKVVVTVPNRDFNDNYGIGEDFRHPDHHWEPGFEDWCDHAVTVAAEHGWQVDTIAIGDSVNDCSVSIMSVFTKETV